MDKGFNLAHRFFGSFWQWELLINFIVSLIICCLPGSRATLGNVNKPEFSFPQWTAMIMCTLLAGGGVFWAACEPLAHFVSSPPLFNLSGDNSQVVSAVLAQPYLHWDFLGWAIFGSTSTIVCMYYHYEKGLPLAPEGINPKDIGMRVDRYDRDQTLFHILTCDNRHDVLTEIKRNIGNGTHMNKKL